MASPLLNLGLKSSGGAGLTDGDKGDVTVAAGGESLSVNNDAVTYAKLQNVSATDKILGRATAGAGDVEEITCTAAGRALLDDADAAAQRTTLGLGLKGALLAKTSNQTGGGGVAVSFHEATYQYGGTWWTSGDNTKLVVPSGVSFVRVGGMLNMTSGGDVNSQIKMNGLEFPGHASAGMSQYWHGLTIWTAVVPVVAGDYFQLIFTGTTSHTIVGSSSAASRRAWFAIEAVL